MNVQRFHQQTIRGLIQTTVNRTHLDLERRELISIGTTVDWNNIRSLVQGIDILFKHKINTQRERLSIENLVVDIRTRITHTIFGIANLEEFEEALARGIAAYSRYIKRNNLSQPANSGGFRQTLEEQFHLGLLENSQRDFQITYRVSRYREYKQRIIQIINQFFLNTEANPNLNRAFQAAIQDCCWCLFNYRNTPLYRTALREYIEDIYIEANRELQHQGFTIQHQGLIIQPIELIRNLEVYIRQQCTYLHFNLENNAAHLIGIVYRRRLIQRQQQAHMDQAAF